jgi:AraC-type DNA-binding domain-containing proteins
MWNSIDSLYGDDGNDFMLETRRYYAINHSFFEMDMHFHKEMEIMYVVHGKCKVLVQKSEASIKEYIVKKGEYIFIDGGIQHKLTVEREAPCRVLNLEMRKIKPRNSISIKKLTEDSSVLKAFIDSKQPIIYGNDDNGVLHSIIVALQTQLQLKLELSEKHIMTDLLMGQFFIELARQCRTINNTNTGKIYIKKALAYISDKYDQEICIKDIAEALHVSSAHLQRVFKREEGESLIDRITTLRIEKAKLLLQISNLPIVDVAISVGFHNRQHFSYVFNKKVGCSPALYRKTKGNSSLWQAF